MKKTKSRKKNKNKKDIELNVVVLFFFIVSTFPFLHISSIFIAFVPKGDFDFRSKEKQISLQLPVDIFTKIYYDNSIRNEEQFLTLSLPFPSEKKKKDTVEVKTISDNRPRSMRKDQTVAAIKTHNCLNLLPTDGKTALWAVATDRCKLYHYFLLLFQPGSTLH